MVAEVTLHNDFEMSKNCPKLSNIAQNCPKLPKIAQNCPKLLKIQRLPQQLYFSHYDTVNVFSGHNRQRLGSRWVVNAVAAVECDPACRNSCYFAIIVLASIRSQKVAPKSPTKSNICLPFEIYLKVGEVGEPHQLAGQPGRIEDQKVSSII